MAKSFETTLVIRGDGKGGVEAVKSNRQEIDRLDKQQRRNEKTTRDWDRSWSTITGTIAAAGAAIGALKLGDMIAQQARAVIESDNLARSIGVQTGQLQAMEYAAGQAGVAQDKMGDILKDVSDKIGDAYANGGGEALDVINNLGLSANKLIQMSPDQQLLAIGSALSQLGSRAEKVNALESLGDDASRLLPLLEDNGREFKRLMRQAYDINVALPDSDIQSYREGNKVIHEMEGTVEGLFNTFTTGIADTNFGPVRDGLDDIRKIVADPDFQQGVVSIATALSDMAAGGGRNIAQLQREMSSFGDRWTLYLDQDFGIGDKLEVAQAKARQLGNELSYLEKLSDGGTMDLAINGYFSRDSLDADIVETRKKYNQALSDTNDGFTALAALAGPFNERQAELSTTALSVAKSLREEQKAAHGTLQSYRDRAQAQAAAKQAAKEHQQALKESASAYDELLASINPTGKAEAEYVENIHDLSVAYQDGKRNQLEYYAGVSAAAEKFNDARRAAKGLRTEQELLDKYAPGLSQLQELARDRKGVANLGGSAGDVARANLQKQIRQVGTSDAPGELSSETYDDNGFGQANRIESQRGEYEQWYQDQLSALKSFQDQRYGVEQEATQAIEALEQQHQQRLIQYEQQAQSARLQGYSSLFGSMAELTGEFAGEQSGIYQTMFAASKAFAIADAIIKIQQGIANAAAMPFPANLGAMASVAASTTSIVSTIEGTSMSLPSSGGGGLAGQAHDGIDSVPREGTWLLDGGERVLNPQQNKDISEFVARENRLASQNPTNNNQQTSATIEQHFHFSDSGSGSSDSRMQQMVRKAAKQGAQQGYQLVLQDAGNNGPIRQKLGV